MPYKKDEEFMAYVGHLIEKPSVQRLKEFPIIFIPIDLNIHQCKLY